MGQIIVRNLDYKVIADLKARAAASNASLEQTAREIPTASAIPDSEECWRRIDAVRARTGEVEGDSSTLIREDRDTR